MWGNGLGCLLITWVSESPVSTLLDRYSYKVLYTRILTVVFSQPPGKIGLRICPKPLRTTIQATQQPPLPMEAGRCRSCILSSRAGILFAKFNWDSDFPSTSLPTSSPEVMLTACTQRDHKEKKKQKQEINLRGRAWSHQMNRVIKQTNKQT